jgi:hypothetical protein
LAGISQVASSTSFLCCSRFSPVAFNLSNTKSSIQLLYVLDCPFWRPNKFDRIQHDRPYIFILSVPLTNSIGNPLVPTSSNNGLVSRPIVYNSRHRQKTILYSMSLSWILTNSQLSPIELKTLQLRLLLTTNWNRKLKKSLIHDSAVVDSFTKFAGRTILHLTILGNPPANSIIPQISLTSSTPNPNKPGSASCSHLHSCLHSHSHSVT